jgi:uncharacterized membrane-anchored protein YjiN (DUF445 family)
MSPDFTTAPQTSVTQAVDQAATERLRELQRLNEIYNVLENLPDINRIERKIDKIAEDVAKLRSSLVPVIVGEDPEDHSPSPRKYA